MNIGDIARMAGVSSAAVSRYFNNGYISEEKRLAISRVVEETGFRPSTEARTLRTKKTHLVGVLIPRIESASVSRMVWGILAGLEDSDYHLVLSDTRRSQEKETDYLSFFATRPVDGIIFVATLLGEDQVELLSELKTPVVILGQDLEGYPSVYQADREATRDLTRAVLDGGSTFPCYIGAEPLDVAVGVNRRAGFLDALAERSMAVMDDRTVVADFSIESGYEQARILLERYPMLDALICATDDMAVGACRLLKERGIAVPEQVQVAGQGASKISRVVTPSLTSVGFDYQESGLVAVRKLLELMEDRKAKPSSQCMPYQILQGESTRVAEPKQPDIRAAEGTKRDS